VTDTYTAEVHWADGYWQADIPELPGAHTFARNTTALRKRLREVVVLMADRPDAELNDEDAFRVNLSISVTVHESLGAAAGGLGVQASAHGSAKSSGSASAVIAPATAPDAALQLAAAARQRAKEAEQEAETATAIAVLLAQAAGISMRDIATLLGVSHQRVQQIAAGSQQMSSQVKTRRHDMGRGNDNDRHVVKREGGWAVVKEDHQRASAVARTQREAVSRAREIVHNAGGGELVIHGEDGKIRAKDTIAPANDPRSSKG
jgi:predicted RNase H-like HicB family nuclease